MAELSSEKRVSTLTTNDLIDACEQYAKSYQGDDRQDVSVDIRNGFYAGAKWQDDIVKKHKEQISQLQSEIADLKAQVLGGDLAHYILQSDTSEQIKELKVQITELESRAPIAADPAVWHPISTVDKQACRKFILWSSVRNEMIVAEYEWQQGRYTDWWISDSDVAHPESDFTHWAECLQGPK